MTNEDKQLLLADLCARLPYDVKVQIKGFDFTFNDSLVQIYNGTIGQSFQVGNNMPYGIEQIKPYLRPMSSMTEEEWNDLIMEQTCGDRERNMVAKFDWLNKKMFDYRGLIPKGLAIEVTKDNNPYKD